MSEAQTANVKFLGTILIIVLVGSGCRTVTTSDGISKSEARRIADHYFGRHVADGVCITGIRDGGDVWVAEGHHGWLSTPMDFLHIDKKTGVITSPTDD